MTRRKLITLLGGLIAAPVAHPFVARADKTRRIGLLINLRSDDPEGQNRLMAFVQALKKFGWTEGSNIHIDLRWASDDADLSRRYAEELVALAPDVLLASGTQAVVAFQRVTRSVPIVFVNATDPVGAGFVSSVARPGGNTTGLVAFEYSISGKWLELLRKLAPQTTRVAVLRDPALASQHWTIRCDTIRSLVFFRGRAERNRFARCQRNRTWAGSVRARAKWRYNYNGKPLDGG
jgi:putative ABC transport system substrate-binding protein